VFYQLVMRNDGVIISEIIFFKFNNFVNQILTIWTLSSAHKNNKY